MRPAATATGLHLTRCLFFARSRRTAAIRRHVSSSCCLRPSTARQRGSFAAPISPACEPVLLQSLHGSADERITPPGPVTTSRAAPERRLPPLSAPSRRLDLGVHFSTAIARDDLRAPTATGATRE